MMATAAANLTPVEIVLDRLGATGRPPRRNGAGWAARCPAHEDRNPSLSIHESPSGSALVYCHAGCTTPDVIAALDLDFRDLFPERQTIHHIDGGRRIDKVYGYHDADGTLAYEVVRYTPKDFRQRRPETNGSHVWNLQGIDRVLYHLPQVRRAVENDQAIWICEGEKDAENATWWTKDQGADIVATTRAGGACTRPEHWIANYTNALTNARKVVIVADDDQPGHTHAKLIHDALSGHVHEIAVVLPAEGRKDLSDHIAHGHTIGELRRIDPAALAPDEPDIPEPDQPEPHRLLEMLVNYEQLFAQDHNDQQWVAWPIFAAGRGHALYAPAKAGKSSVILAAAAATATGRPVFGQPPSAPRHVLYCDYEMTDADFLERLEELGYTNADTDQLQTFLHYALLPALQPLDTPEGAVELLELAELVDAELVIVDTFGRAVQGEENDNDVVRAFYRLVGRPLKAAGRAWLRTDHAGKDLEKGQRGASAKNDDVDVVWKLNRTDAGALLTRTHSRMNWVPDKVALRRQIANDIITWVPTEDRSYLPGTKDLAAELDELEIPAEATNAHVYAAYRASGRKAKTNRLSDAIRWRKEAGTTLRNGYIDRIGNSEQEPSETSLNEAGNQPGNGGNRPSSPTGNQPPSLIETGLVPGPQIRAEDLI